mmetsp:Transcript_7824/g.11423  ORF Transcript_7824/g.11423 Transcript_7824/m.11423 type:complete len:118 (-) Transcript_7824:44-397(-)
MISEGRRHARMMHAVHHTVSRLAVSGNQLSASYCKIWRKDYLIYHTVCVAADVLHEAVGRQGAVVQNRWLLHHEGYTVARVTHKPAGGSAVAVAHIVVVVVVVVASCVPVQIQLHSL